MLTPAEICEILFRPATQNGVEGAASGAVTADSAGQALPRALRISLYELLHRGMEIRDFTKMITAFIDDIHPVFCKHNQKITIDTYSDFPMGLKNENGEPLLTEKTADLLPMLRDSLFQYLQQNIEALNLSREKSPRPPVYVDEVCEAIFRPDKDNLGREDNVRHLPRELELVTNELVARGMNRDNIRKIMYGFVRMAHPVLAPAYGHPIALDYAAEAPLGIISAETRQALITPANVDRLGDLRESLYRALIQKNAELDLHVREPETPRPRDAFNIAAAQLTDIIMRLPTAEESAEIADRPAQRACMEELDYIKEIRGPRPWDMVDSDLKALMVENNANTVKEIAHNATVRVCHDAFRNCGYGTPPDIRDASAQKLYEWLTPITDDEFPLGLYLRSEEVLPPGFPADKELRERIAEVFETRMFYALLEEPGFQNWRRPAPGQG